MGSSFAISEESSAHPDFKKLVTELDEGGTKLALKKLAPTRLVKNNFYEQVDRAEKLGNSVDMMRELLGHSRAKKGMFEGDLENGELEIGQVSAQIYEILPVAEIMRKLMAEYNSAKMKLEETDYSF